MSNAKIFAIIFLNFNCRFQVRNFSRWISNVWTICVIGAMKNLFLLPVEHVWGKLKCIITYYYWQHIYCAKKDKIAVLLVRVKITALNQTSWYQSHEQLRQLLGRLLFYVEEKKLNWSTYLKKIGFGSTYCSKETQKKLHILCSIRKSM